MKKTLKIFAIIIAIFSFLVVVANIAVSIETIVKTILGEINQYSVTSLLSVAIGIPFGVTEIINGVAIIKLTKEDKVNSSLKPLVGLSNSLVNGLIAEATATLVIEIAFVIIGGGGFEIQQLLLVLFSLLFFATSKVMTSQLKKNRYLSIGIMNLVFVVVAFIYFPFIGVFDIEGIIDILGLVLTFISLGLIVVYCCISFGYYKKYRDEIETEYESGLDYDVVKKFKNDSELIKIYQQRPGKGSKAVMALYTIGIACYFLFVGLSILRVYMNGGTISFDFSIPSNAYGLIDTMDGLFCFSMLLSLPSVVVMLIDLYTHNSSNYWMLTCYITMSKYFVFMGLMSFAFIPLSFIYTDTDSALTMLTFFPSLTGLLYIPMLILLILGKNNLQKTRDALANGETFISDIDHAKKGSLFYFISFMLPVIPYTVLSILNNSYFNFGIIPYVISGILMVVATFLNKKHPIEESILAIKKPKPSEDDEEIIDAVLVEDK